MDQVLKLSRQAANNSNQNNNGNNGQNTIMQTTDDKTRLQALSLINDCYKYIMDLTTNGVVITDAIKFVQNIKEKLKVSKEENDKKSQEPNYNQDKEQLEEE